MNCYSKLDMAERRKRQFNCKPCGKKHPAPVNANCEFQRARQAEGDQSEDENPQPGPSNMEQTLRGTRRRTVGAAQTPKAKPSKRALAEEDSPGSAHEQPGREDPLDRIMQRLDSLADEGRRARQNLADETRREHEKLRQAMRSMQARQTADILSDEEERTPRKRRRTDADLSPEELDASPEPLQTLRQDKRSAEQGEGILR